MSIIKSIIKRLIVSKGYSIYRNGVIPSSSSKSMMSGLERMKNLGIEPYTIVDVGAAQGTWTEKAMDFWPTANYELIEPLIEQVKLLENLKIKHGNVNYHMAVAGEEAGETVLNISSDLDGSGIYGITTKNLRIVPVISIDQVLQNSTGTIMIKLDTHGYEVPILKGAKSSLEKTCLLIIEVYGFYVSPTALLFHQLSTYLDTLGFRLIDIVDIMRRPGDQAFWQADAFYIKKDHPVFERNSYA